MNDDAKDKILNDYVKKFGKSPPEPFGVVDGFYFEVIKKHLLKGVPIPDDFNWYPNLPEGAVV